MENKTCSICSFFHDFQGTQFASIFKDGVPTRCMKESRRAPGGWPPAVADATTEGCHCFVELDPLRSRWEWDENKNELNRKKHGYSFQDAIRAKESDPYCIRQPVGNPDKWEDIEGLDFKKLGIPETLANRDPIRDEHIFMMDGNLFKMVTRLRGESGLIKQRIISVHRASKKRDRDLYEYAKEKVKKGSRLI